VQQVDSYKYIGVVFHEDRGCKMAPSLTPRGLHGLTQRR
jgi:hypothetical protein